MKPGWRALAIVTGLVVAAEVDAAGTFPVTPALGGPILVATLLAAIAEGTWFARLVPSRPFLVGITVVLGKAVTAVALMLTYLLLSGSLRGAPAFSDGDQWAIFWWDIPFLLATVVVFASVQRRAILYVVPSSRGVATWPRVLRTSAISQGWVLIAFALAAHQGARV